MKGDDRWTTLSPRNPLPKKIERSFWSGWMGNGSARRDDCTQDDGLARMGTYRWWSVRPPPPPSLSYFEFEIDELVDRLVSVARGEQTFFDPAGLPTATEGCKSNALMRCCKDLGIASELWLVPHSLLPSPFFTTDVAL